MASSSCQDDTKKWDPKRGSEGYGTQSRHVVGVFILPLTLGVGAALAVNNSNWIPEHNVTLVLTASLTLLAVLYVPYFADFMSGLSKRDRAENPESPEVTARTVTGFMASLAILAILVHIATNDYDEPVADTLSDASIDIGVNLRADPLPTTTQPLEWKSQLADSHDVKATLIPAEESTIPAEDEPESEASDTHLVRIHIMPKKSTPVEAARDYVRSWAVVLTVAALGSWVLTRSILGLAAAPTPPVLGSTRLRITGLHLIVPALVLLVLMVWSDGVFDAWWSAFIMALVILAGWQMVLTLSRNTHGGMGAGVRIASAITTQNGQISPPHWCQSVFRALIVGSSVAFPVGVWFSLIESVLDSTFTGIAPVAAVVLCLLPGALLMLSIPAHPGGRGLHDLWAGTVVVDDEWLNCHASATPEPWWGPPTQGEAAGESPAQEG